MKKEGFKRLFCAKAGFTLIELLVVVLIIGILSAVALPQYNKAVEKSRATQAITLLKTVYQFAQNYYLQNGRWPQKFENLDMEVPWEKSTFSPNLDPYSNGEWSVSFSDASLISEERGYNRGIQIRKVAGSYTNVGFEIWETRDEYYKKELRREIMCVEYYMGSNKFTGNIGDYCVKIMGGSFLTSDDGNAKFKLP